MVRVLAEYDPDRIVAVIKWPLREAMLRFVAIVKKAALEAYRHECDVWASIAPYAEKKSRPPRPPAILRERRD